MVLSVLGLLVPVGLELLGVLPMSYAFEGGRITVLPQMIELSPKLTMGSSRSRTWVWR